jgi:hypothetical protein
MSRDRDPFQKMIYKHQEIDPDVAESVQKNIPQNIPRDVSFDEISRGEGSRSKIKTFFGEMPKKSHHEIWKEMTSPERLKEDLDLAIGSMGGTGMKLVGGVAGKAVSQVAPKIAAAAEKPLETVKKGVQYFQPEKEVEGFAKKIAQGAETHEENATTLGERIRFAGKSREREALQHKTNAESKINVNESIVPKEVKLTELKHLEDVSGNIQKPYKRFLEDTSYKNADDLRSAIGKEESTYFGKQLSKEEGRKLQELKRTKKFLENLQKNHLKKVDPKLEKEFTDFLSKYKEFAESYKANKFLRKIARGDTSGIKSSSINSTFSSPDKAIMRVVEDIGQSGKENILQNVMKGYDPSDVSKYTQGLISAYKNKGFSYAVKPEEIKFLKGLEKRLGRKQMLQGMAGGFGIGEMLGIPMAGTAIGAFAKPLAKHGFEFAKHLARMRGR